jgi:hypothetical protein
MNRPCDLTSRRLDALDIALPFERARHLDAEVDIHRLIPAFCVVMQEQVVSRAQSAILSQKGPHLIERRLPCSGDAADSHFGPDCCHQLCLPSFHHNVVVHGHGPSRRERQSTASTYRHGKLGAPPNQEAALGQRVVFRIRCPMSACDPSHLAATSHLAHRVVPALLAYGRLWSQQERSFWGAPRVRPRWLHQALETIAGRVRPTANRWAEAWRLSASGDGERARASHYPVLGNTRVNAATCRMMSCPGRWNAVEMRNRKGTP